MITSMFILQVVYSRPYMGHVIWLKTIMNIINQLDNLIYMIYWPTLLYSIKYTNFNLPVNGIYWWLIDLGLDA